MEYLIGITFVFIVYLVIAIFAGEIFFRILWWREDRREQKKKKEEDHDRPSPVE